MREMSMKRTFGSDEVRYTFRQESRRLHFWQNVMQTCLDYQFDVDVVMYEILRRRTSALWSNVEECLSVAEEALVVANDAKNARELARDMG